MASNPQSLIPNPDLDLQVRRIDEDRWLASRFAPAPLRRRLIALYALNYEIAHVSETVTQPAVGDIRLAWWREAMAAVHEGGAPPPHPVVAAYAAAHAETPFTLSIIERLINARRKDFDPLPFATWDDAEDYIDATAGGVIRLALEATGEPGEAADLARAAGLLWGATGLLRAEQHWRALGRSAVPVEGGAMQHYAELAHDALAQLSTTRLPAPAFPALGYVALARMYLRRPHAASPLLVKQFKLIAAAATGGV